MSASACSMPCSNRRRAIEMRSARTRVALLPLILLCCAWTANRAGDSRSDAMRFILEKLNVRAGDSWDRSGRFFLWHFAFSPDGCALTVERSATNEEAVYTQTVPLADVNVQWDGRSSLRFSCLRGDACIRYEDLRDRKLRRGDRTQGELLVMQPDDLPKLFDAFGELHRLCDDPYQR